MVTSALAGREMSLFLAWQLILAPKSVLVTLGRVNVFWTVSRYVDSYVESRR